MRRASLRFPKKGPAHAMGGARRRSVHRGEWPASSGGGVNTADIEDARCGECHTPAYLADFALADAVHIILL